MGKKVVLGLFFFILLISLASAEEFGYNYLEGELNVAQAVNYTLVSVNDSLLWDGNTWSNTRWLNIDGSNANTNVDIGINWFKGLFDWTIGDSWNTFDGSTLTFNESKLSSTYYNATVSQIVAGSLDGGTLANTKHSDGNYDSLTMNVSEVSGSPALDLRVNFTGVDSFSRGVMRYKTSSLSGDVPLRQLWNYNTGSWDSLASLSTSEDFAIVTQPVFNNVNYIQDNIIQLRIYKSSNGNTNNHYYIDWVAMVGGYGVPSGQEIHRACPTTG